MYNEGDYVLMKDTCAKSGISLKLKPNYKGPYVVKKTLGNNRYVIVDIPGFNLTSHSMKSILLSDRLKYWIKPVIK